MDLFHGMRERLEVSERTGSLGVGGMFQILQRTKIACCVRSLGLSLEKKLRVEASDYPDNEDQAWVHATEK